MRLVTFLPGVVVWASAVAGAQAHCALDPTDPSVTICAPANRATVTSPLRLVVGTKSRRGIASIHVYVDDVLAYRVHARQVDTRLALRKGRRHIVVVAWDRPGRVFTAAIKVNVTAAATTTTTTSTGTSTSNPPIALVRPPRPPRAPQDIHAINHIIYMLQENRSFDSYFGQLNAYRVRQGLPQEVDGLPAGASNLNFDDTAAINSYHFNTVCHLDMSPSWNESHVDFNRNDPASSSGLNDGFAYTAGKYGRDNGYWDVEGVRAMGYYDWTDLPYYYFMATEFATSDRWFAPAPTRTAPNRDYAVSATSAGHAYPAITAMTNTTIFELLQRAGISWRVYVSTPGVSILYDFAFSSQFPDHFAPATQFAADAANGTLPAVALIEQKEGEDEHPGNNVQTGAQYVSGLINSLMNSPSWKDSVFILSYDEGGAMYDHVPSPPAHSPDGIPPIDLAPTDIRGDFTRYGFRVPVMVISPFTRPHYVSHTVADHTSILRLIENRFGLASLTVRDGTAMDMTEFFDFVNVPWRTPPTPPAQPTSGNCYYDHLP